MKPNRRDEKNVEFTEAEMFRKDFIDKEKQIEESQYEIDKKRLRVLICESLLVENNKIIKKGELAELKDVSKEFRKDLYRSKSTVSPLIIKKIKDSLKYNPDFSATDISERLQVPIITVVKADIDLGLSISTDAQKTEVANKVLLYSLITKLQDSISQMDDHCIKIVADKFNIAKEHLEQIEQYYELGIMIKS